jgi:hypothetical protein
MTDFKPMTIGECNAAALRALQQDPASHAKALSAGYTCGRHGLIDDTPRYGFNAVSFEFGECEGDDRAWRIHVMTERDDDYDASTGDYFRDDDVGEDDDIRWEDCA